MIGFILEKIVANISPAMDLSDVRQHSPYLLLFHERLIYCLTFTHTSPLNHQHNTQKFTKKRHAGEKSPKITGQTQV